MTDASDAELVGKVLAGETRAFGHLVDRYQDQMLAYARYMGFSEADSLDLVQDSMVRAFRHLGRCGDPTRFDGWLFKIVSNVCKTAGRKASRRRSEPLQPLGSFLRSEAARPDELAESSWMRERVRQALATVPHDQREALVLMYLEGLSVAEIHEVTGASPSAIKMRLKRGREALKGELEPLFTEVDES
jgi:RNA polymerase sigma-70 factor (ECF subfamily)